MLKKLSICALTFIALLLAGLLAFPDAVLAEFTPSDGQAATLVLGQPNFTSSAGTHSQAGMYFPTGVSVDPITQKVFVADTFNNRVLRYASVTALYDGAAAEAVLGQADYTSRLANRGGEVADNTMNSPYSVFVDSGGRLWVVDTYNNRILRFDNASSRGNGVNADRVLGQPNFTSNSEATTQNGMSLPQGVFVDSSGRLWASDSGNSRILRFDNAASKVSGANADGVLGQADFDSSYCLPIDEYSICSPSGVFVDATGRLWVADSTQNRVLRFDDASAKANGAAADGVLGQGTFWGNSFDCSQNRMKFPTGVNGDATGRLFVVDTDNHRVLIFNDAAGMSNGADASTVLGQSNFTTCTENTGGISAASLSRPRGSFYDLEAEILWVTDANNNRVIRYGTTRQAATQVIGQVDFTSNIAATTQTGMNHPYGVTVDPTTHKVFVADFSNNRVLRFASVIALTNGAAAEGVLGQANFNSGSANRGGAAAANTIDNPTAVFIDTTGRLWVADYDNHRVLRFDNATAKSDGADADGVLGQLDFTSNAPATAQNRMWYPLAVFVDSGGRLWVSDKGNNRVLRFDDAASKFNGADADGLLGQTNFTNGTGATSASRMNGPAGLFVDSEGRLWVAEMSNHRVLRFDNAAAKMNGDPANGVLGQLYFSGNLAGCTQRKMNTPRGLSGDLAGRLYVADGNNHRILIYENAAELSNYPNANNEIGQLDFTTCIANSGGISAYSLNTPTLLFYDEPTDVLWVADWTNNRVLRYGTPHAKLFLPIVKQNR